MRFAVRRLAHHTNPIPVIDFGRFLKGNTHDRAAVATAVLDAFERVGFVYLANHSIAKQQLNNVFGASKAFFDKPLDEKNKFAWVSPEANRGYVAPGREKVSRLEDQDKIKQLREKSPDLKESFEIGKEPSPTFQNNWPDTKFQQTMMTFFNDAHELHLNVMDAIGLGLGFKPRYFDRFCDAKDHNLRLLHYPSVPKTQLDKEGQTRAGAHTDYGSVTLLFQDDKGGLQVKNTAGEYIYAPPIEGSIVVNAGDLLARWSNDRIKSTEHRVVSPPTQSLDKYPARYSIAFFCNPNFSANIECLDGCWSAQKPKKYPAVNSFDYLVSRLKATY